ncbi:hypothetical protein TSOC_009481 [Tetrabaena socialis]|uniref:Uncharacterized protein n=1 Tax=Tetrabaena socialis TaxID=47790 RepID=A0A2J7ZVU8_9CHLO|nr:hypothetical protein TSOC_009481 [Tetrabaena socialis]|eukprot:PNH04368.1 hypothetical protein TSOC_009481 [Tetrabaena socialis]
MHAQHHMQRLKPTSLPLLAPPTRRRFATVVVRREAHAHASQQPELQPRRTCLFVYDSAAQRLVARRLVRPQRRAAEYGAQQRRVALLQPQVHEPGRLLGGAGAGRASVGAGRPSGDEREDVLQEACDAQRAPSLCLTPCLSSNTLACPRLLSLPDRLLQDILALVPGGPPGVDGGAPCACAALRAAWQEGFMHREQSAVAVLLAEHGELALAGTLYDRPRTTDRGGGGAGVWPALVCWAAVQVAAQGGCPPHEQATQLVKLGMHKRDAALLRAVLGSTALRPYLRDGAWLASYLSVAAVAGDPGEGGHQAARDEALRCAVRSNEAGAARLLLAAGADARGVLLSVVDGSSVNQLRLLADLGVRFSAYNNGGLLGHAVRYGSSPAAVSELLRRDAWERGQVRAALGVATAHNRAEVAALLRNALTAVAAGGGTEAGAGAAGGGGGGGAEAGPVAAGGGGGGGVWAAVRGALYALGVLLPLAAEELPFVAVVWGLLVQRGEAEEECAPGAADGGLGGGEGAGAAQPGVGFKPSLALRVALVAGLVFAAVLSGDEGASAAVKSSGSRPAASTGRPGVAVAVAALPRLPCCGPCNQRPRLVGL